MPRIQRVPVLILAVRPWKIRPTVSLLQHNDELVYTFTVQYRLSPIWIQGLTNENEIVNSCSVRFENVPIPTTRDCVFMHPNETFN